MQELTIQLTQGKNALVDTADFERLQQWKWVYSKNGYALAHKKNTKNAVIYLHHNILDNPQNLHIDHINGNKLDNRRCNLRLCSRSENQANQRKRLSITSSKYKGVSWFKRSKKWRVQIQKENCNRHIGYFDSEIKAAIAYNEAAQKYFGEFACLNAL